MIVVTCRGCGVSLRTQSPVEAAWFDRHHSNRAIWKVVEDE